MDEKIIKKANCGQNEKADCQITISPANSIIIEIQSKVKSLFGKSIERSVKEILENNKIQNAKVIVNDFGALDWVIRARLECAIQRAKGRKNEK